MGNAGSIGIKPKRYTIEWIQANKERERIENTNPVTRYLDRRRHERGGTWIAQYHLPWHPYFLWMGDTHDPDYPEISWEPTSALYRQGGQDFHCGGVDMQSTSHGY